jgi:DNA-binding protein HU-beta
MANKEQLIDKIAAKTGKTKNDTAAFLNAFINVIHASLVSGDGVQLIGFGSFNIAKRKATTGRNPRTGAPLKIPAKKVVKFVAGKKLKESVNKK